MFNPYDLEESDEGHTDVLSEEDRKEEQVFDKILPSSTSDNSLFNELSFNGSPGWQIFC